MDDGTVTRKRKRQTSGARKFIQKLEFQFFNHSKVADLLWLKNEIASSADGWVRMNVLYSKNGVKESEFNSKLLHKLADESKFIEINNDATLVRLNMSNNKTNGCKIFVDKLPTEADSNWIRDAFCRFGHIMHVECPKPKCKSLKPKLKPIRKNKGFCFIQFTDPTSALKVLNNFGKIDKNIKVSNSGKKVVDDDDDSKNEINEEPPKKKMRTDASVPKQKTNRKCRKRNKNTKLRLRKNVEHRRQTTKGLAVYSYDEWSRLKSEYLTKQKENFSALKKNLKRCKFVRNEQIVLSKKKRGQEKIEDKAASALNASLKECTVERKS